MKKKNKAKGTWGGARKRKTKKEATKVMRVPVSKFECVYNFVKGITKTIHPMP